MSLVRAMNVDGGAASATAASPHVEHGRECSWSVENDARRPATKQLVEGLHTKIQMLEAELNQLKRRAGISTEGDQEPSTPLDDTPVFPRDQAEPSMFESERPEAPSVQRKATVMYRFIFDIDASVPINDQPNDVRLSLVCQWNRHLPQLPYFTRLEHDTLLSRCFKYGVTWLHCMLPEVFLRDMLYSLTSEPSTVGNQPQYPNYTPMLHCALLAYAAAFSDDPEIRSPSFRAELARYAKEWLDYEFERPVMALVRSLALLAEYHCGIGEGGAGYMYMGMSICAVRLLVHRHDELSPEEGAAATLELVERDWYFWSVFCQDKVMALEFKQPYSLPVSHLGASLPPVDTELDSQPWSDGLTRFPPRLTTKTFFDSCKLMVISARIIESLYDKYQGIQDKRSVISIHLQLDTWFNSLPRELLVWVRSTSPLPHLIALHICYWFLIIRLHQPFYGRSTISEADSERGSNATIETPSQSGGGPIHDLSTKMVDRATHKIVQLLQMFEEHHGMRFFPRNILHVIYECGVALLNESASVPAAATKKRANILEAVNACLHALRGTATTWPWAGKLAGQLEGKLNEVRVNNTAHPFVSDWTVPGGETNQMGQTYPFAQVWEPTGFGSPSGSSSMNQLSGMHISSSKSRLDGQLGLGLSPHQHQMWGNLTTPGNPEETEGDPSIRNVMRFSGSSSSSAAPYPLPLHHQQGTNSKKW
ncbi:hypothetical protein B0J17DRAFT_718012 [Rhizoctonia solani]|nr:hypothetical protein B0J17DRAFT_718012 [Rhizoctonia solani]